MVSTTVTSTDMQNNFGKYLNMVMNGYEVIVTKNGRVVGRFVPKGEALSYLTDSLRGILRDENTEYDPRDKALREKYETAD